VYVFGGSSDDHPLVLPPELLFEFYGGIHVQRANARVCASGGGVRGRVTAEGG
jgi:hypothetical protein